MIYYFIDYLTNHGENKLLTQFIFAIVQFLVALLVSEIYKYACPVPQICFAFLFTVRGRNVFVNGLFNDTFEVLFIYLGIYLMLVQRRWALSLLSFSAATSVRCQPCCMSLGSF